jgi:segregation and condensation protein A
MREPLYIDVPGFQGTLDELIHLVRQGPLNLTSLPLSAIASQLLKRIQLIAGKEKLESGEAVEITATLIRIKSYSLLPQEPDSLQEIAVSDSRSARRTLIQDLDSLRLSVERLREMWAHALPPEASRFQPPVEPDQVVDTDNPSLFDLLRSLEEALHLTRNAPPPLFYRQDAYPLEELAAWILERLQEVQNRGKPLFLNSLFHEIPAIAPGIFLAALELARSGSLTMAQSNALDEITMDLMAAP